MRSCRGLESRLASLASHGDLREALRLLSSISVLRNLAVTIKLTFSNTCALDGDHFDVYLKFHEMISNPHMTAANRGVKYLAFNMFCNEFGIGGELL